jgi:hypothetical protein
MYETSKEFSTICKALLEVQNKFIVIKATTKGHLNEYASYPDLIKEAKPVLSEAGILLLQPVTCLPDNQPAITTILIHPAAAEWIKSISPIREMSSTNINAAQQVGGGISYMKRYTLAAMLAWATGDYDFDEGVMAEEDKKTQFIIDSFEKLVEKSGMESSVMAAVGLVTKYENKKRLYAMVKDVVLPKAKEDKEAAKGLLDNAILELS